VHHRPVHVTFARAPPHCTRHTALHVPFPRLPAIPGRRESCRESSGKLRPPVHLAMSLQPQCAYRKSARATRMCRYLEQLLYRSTVYLPDRPRICPSVRASIQATDHSVYMSVHPSVTFNDNDLRSSAYLTDKIGKSSKTLRPVTVRSTRRQVPENVTLQQHSRTSSNFTARNTNPIYCVPIDKHDVHPTVQVCRMLHATSTMFTPQYRSVECSMQQARCSTHSTGL
jgi:hypothetical protein